MTTSCTYDLFISYSHLDNEPIWEGNNGWVTVFHLVLEKILGQKLGRKPKIWRDQRYTSGNTEFRKSLDAQLSKAKLFVPIVTPRYINSNWCRYELRTFAKGRIPTGIYNIDDLSCIFKVLKSPCDFGDLTSILQDLPGYFFYREEPETGMFRELNPEFGEAFRSKFLLQVDQLANEIAETLKRFDQKEALSSQAVVKPDSMKTVFLAESGIETTQQRVSLEKALRLAGVYVLPDRSIPNTYNDLQPYLRSCLEKSVLYIHILGNQYGHGPWDHPLSVEEIQYEAVRNLGKQPLIWIPPELHRSDPKGRQKRFLEAIFREANRSSGPLIFRSPMDDLITHLHGCI